jgi:hypothetical protein
MTLEVEGKPALAGHQAPAFWQPPRQAVGEQGKDRLIGARRQVDLDLGFQLDNGDNRLALNR